MRRPAALRGGDVGQPDQVRGDARQEPDLPAEPHRFLQAFPRRVQPTGDVLRDAQVPQRVRLRQLVAGPRRQLERAFQGGHRGVVVVSYHLVVRADPEQRLPFAARVAELLVELRRTREQLKLARVLVLLRDVPGVHDPAAGQGEIGLDRVQVPFGRRQRAAVATHDGAFIEQSRPLDPIRRIHRRPSPVSPSVAGREFSAAARGHRRTKPGVAAVTAERRG